MDMGDRIRPFRGSRYPGVGDSGFRRRLFERYGNFNTALGRSGSNPLGGEEKDFFMRMRSQGIRYYFVPGADPSYHTRIEAVGRVFRAADADDRRQRADTNARRGEIRLPPAAARRSGQMGRHARAGYRVRAAGTGDQRTLPDPDACETSRRDCCGECRRPSGTHDPDCRPHDRERGVKISEASRSRKTETDTAESPCKRIRMISVSGRSYLPAQAYEKRKEYIRKRTMLRRFSDPFSHADARNRNDRTASVRYVPDL